jgi:hypothetical protein
MAGPIPKEPPRLAIPTRFLATPAHADTVTIGWWDKSIGGPVTTLSATSGAITPTSPIVDVIAMTHANSEKFT